jgi:hypothetical protein
MYAWDENPVVAVYEFKKKDKPFDFGDGEEESHE